MEGFHLTHFGRERCEADDLPRHRHEQGYVTLVLAGRYVEAGDAGRFEAGPGDVLLHRPFEAHLDRFAERSADLINLPLPVAADGHAFGRIADPDAAMRLAERDPAAAARWLLESIVPGVTPKDWPDLLAAHLARAAPLRIGEWARRHGLAPATVSRGFRQVFGTTPERYRAEARARHAWRMAAHGQHPLAEIAFALGFADQAHMTRAVSALTGRSPGRWRPSVNCVQDPMANAA